MGDNKNSAEELKKHQTQQRQGGPMGPVMRGDKAKDFKGTMLKLMVYLGAQKWKVIIAWIFAVAATIISLNGPKISGQATDQLVQGISAMAAGTGGIDFGAIGRILMTLTIVYAISSGFQYIQALVMSGVTNKLAFRLRSELDAKIHSLPLGFYDTTNHGEILSRISNDVDTVAMSLNQSITQVITSVTALAGILVMMLTISWKLTLIALCVIPFSLIFVAILVKISQKHFRNQQKFLGKLNGHVEEMYGAHMVVKSFRGEDKSYAQFEEYNETLYKSAWKANFLSGLMMPITAFVGNLGYVVICIMGGSFAAAGEMTIGGIQSFLSYVRQFNQPLAQMANISNVLQQTAAAAERIFAFLAETDEPADSVSPASAKGIRGGVAFSDVRFGYDPAQEIIHGFSADIKPGQKIAIVGPTGAGKTTLVKLLMRFYDIWGGNIRLDGTDIRDFKRAALREQFGMVLQDTWLYNGSIGENIRYGKLEATDAEVREAAAAAQADSFIQSLPGGYDMVLNEEASNVSAGQKQLLTIARCILADPKILILDEATSSVDTRTEIQIQKAMDNLMKGRTSFIIAHRLSTIRNADLILCLKDGDIAEQGSHEQLLEKGGFYANLYNSQFEEAV